MLAVRPVHAAIAQGAEAALLIAVLRVGGVVAVMRHGIADRSQIDTGDLHNRAGQRNRDEGDGSANSDSPKGGSSA